MSVRIDSLSASEDAFLNHYSGLGSDVECKWGTIDQTELAVSGSLSLENARKIADAFSKQLNSQLRKYCPHSIVFKGLPTDGSSYYLVIPRKEIPPSGSPAGGGSKILSKALSRLSISRSPSSPAPAYSLPQHPVRSLNGRLYNTPNDPKDILKQLEKHFIAAQKELNKAENPDWPSTHLHVCSCELSPEINFRDIKYKLGVCSAEGRRPPNEDMAMVQTITINANGRDIAVPLFGIFDGHSADHQTGRSHAKYLSEKFPAYFKVKLQAALDALKQDQQQAQGWMAVAISNAFTQSFVDLGEVVHTKYKGDSAGTTATVSCIIDGKVWTACVGDSRAILVNGGQTIALSKDATPVDPASLGEGQVLPKNSRSVYNRGSEIMTLSRMPRTASGLSITHALGHDVETEGISPRPEITSVEIPKAEKEKMYLVIASDGLWGMASSLQVARTVAELSTNSCDKIALSLVQKAYGAASEDNITALVVELNN